MIMSYSIRQLKFLDMAQYEKMHPRLVLEELADIYENLESDELIHPELSKHWNKVKKYAMRLYPENIINKMNEKFHNYNRIDEDIFKLDFSSNTKITFLLGAGASAPSEIPTVTTLLTSLWEKARKLNRDDIDELAKFCEKNRIQNIEDLLTAAYFSNFAAKKNSVLSLLNYFLFSGNERNDRFFGESIQKLSSDVNTASISFLQETLQILFGLLTSTMIKANPNNAHDAIAQFVKEHKETSIITTNYDCCMDEALASNQLEIKTSIDSKINNNSKDGIELIKMHGSINWAYCESCQYTREFNLSKMKETYLEDSASYPVIGICPKCTGQRRPLLVPPLSFKFMMFPSLIRLWNSAREKIENAEYLIVIGYSFSDADNYITKIVSLSMSMNPNQKMIVVTKDSELVELLRNKFSVSIESFNKKRILEACQSCDVILPQILTSDNKHNKLDNEKHA